MRKLELEEGKCAEDLMHIHSNEAGFMNAKDYSAYVHCEQLLEAIQGANPSGDIEGNIFTDDGATCHKGFSMDGKSKTVVDHCNIDGEPVTVDKLYEHLRTTKIGIPPCHTRFRPNDQRFHRLKRVIFNC